MPWFNAGLQYLTDDGSQLLAIMLVEADGIDDVWETAERIAPKALNHQDNLLTFESVSMVGESDPPEHDAALCVWRHTPEDGWF